MADELYRKSAFELAALIRARQVKPSELMEATLARIAAINPKVNAFCALRADQAMAEAHALDEKLARREEVGTLAGLPLGVKDLEDAAGLPTTFGSVPFKNHMPEADSAHVARLKAAGAIVVGKTNTPEFGCTGFTRNLLFGVTRNPWNPERTPGGSSGGSGAAIAAAMVPLATGSDAGGSIRIPASYTGCFGFKPSRGRIPLSPMLGIAGWTDTLVVGPLTRTVRDAAMYVDAAVGYDPSDYESLPHPGISYLAMLERFPRNARVAFHPDFGHAIVQHDVMREVTKAVDAFKQMGCSVDVLDDNVPEIGPDWMRFEATCMYAWVFDLIEKHRGEFGRAFLAGAESAAQFGWDKVAAVQRKRAELNRWCQRVFERYDLLLTPTLPSEAFAAGGPPPSEIDGKPLPDVIAAVMFTYPFNMSGHPAASVRAGMTDSGLPCGLQIVAERHRDDLVLQASYAYEQARPWNNSWPQI
ncbi:MAG: amidase [Candidatus Binataceae bacterium]|jgi:aspartyl-tRNA(Asn)/glutamyl-tRNA(Gln) amidotransferase subunit A